MSTLLLRFILRNWEIHSWWFRKPSHKHLLSFSYSILNISYLIFNIVYFFTIVYLRCSNLWFYFSI
nr:MAG TPA_asm: hypothetical protein [Bacteriophage sp.]